MKLRKKIIQTRNAVMGQKATTVGKLMQSELKRKPTISVIVGSNHTGIEQELTSTEAGRMQTIKDDLREDTYREGKIVRIDFVPSEKHPGNIEVKVEILNDPNFTYKT